MIEHELDNGPQEQPVEPVKKNNTRKIVKRTFTIAGLALAVYFLYSMVHLFVSPDRNIQQIYLVPEDAVFIIQSSAPVDDWGKFSMSATWQCLKRAKAFEDVTRNVETLDTVVRSNKMLLSLVGKRDMLISIHKVRARDWDFLIVLDMQKASKMDLLKDQPSTHATSPKSVLIILLSKPKNWCPAKDLSAFLSIMHACPNS